MSSPTFRGFLVGGLIGVILHLIVRFILSNLVWIALAVMFTWVLSEFSPENPKEVATRATLNSFNPNSVLVSNARGITTSYSTTIGEISATIQNTGQARIYDLWVSCSFKPMPPSGPSEAEPQWDIARVRTNYHLGYVAPGAVVGVRFIPEPDGYLREADPNSFDCKPHYEVERADLLKDQPQ